MEFLDAVATQELHLIDGDAGSDELSRLGIIVQALESLPEGPYQAIELKKPVKAAAGAAYARVESSKGELGHYIIADGGKTPFRNKVRSPSYCNLHVIEKIGPGLMISDLVATVDLGEPVSLAELSVRFVQDANAWIFLPVSATL